MPAPRLAPVPDDIKAPLGADFRSLVDIESELPGHLFGDSFNGFASPLDMREAEMAVGTPYASELNYREILADSLAEFLTCARNLWNVVRFYAEVRG